MEPGTPSPSGHDEESFLNLLRANPDDVATRLIYADWLEERGDPRAEILRLEVEAAQVHARLSVLRQQSDRHWMWKVCPAGLRSHSWNLTHGELQLQSGRTIQLRSLDQKRTYAGLYAGSPDREDNEEFIERALRDARTHAHGRDPHLIPPPRRDYYEKPGDKQHLMEELPPRNPEWLPRIRCIGSFDSSEPTKRQPEAHCSGLTIVWFQEEFAPPIQEPALRQLLDLDWDGVAVDGYY